MARRGEMELPDFGGPPLDVRRPVLFVPGIFTTYMHSALLRKRLQSRDVEVYNLNFSRFGTGALEKHARELRDKVEEIGTLLDAESVHLICYGAGGAVARHYRECLGGADCLGTVIALDELESRPFYARSSLLWSERVFRLAMDALAGVRDGGNGREAELARARFVEMSEFIADNPSEAGAFFSRGTLLAEHGHWEAAIEDLDRAIDLRPDFTEALYMRALVFARKLRYDENPLQCQAIRDFNQVIRAKPGHVQAYHHRGVCYALLGEWRGAVESWDQALILNRDYFPAYLARGLGHIRLGEPALAGADLREVLRLQPDNAEAARLLATL